MAAADGCSRLQQGGCRIRLRREDGRKLRTAGSMTGGRAAADVGSPTTEPVDVRPVRRASGAQAPADRRRRRSSSALAIVAGLRLAVAGALRPISSACSGTHLVLATLTFPVWIVSFSLNKLYQARAVERPTEELRRIVNASLVAIGVIVAVSFALQFKALSRLWVVLAAGLRHRRDGRRAHGRPADVHQDAPRRSDLPAGADHRHRRRRRRPAARRPARAAPRLPGRRLRRRRRHRRPRRLHACSAHRPDRGDPRGDRRHRRADLAVVGRVGGRQPPDPRPHRRRLPRRPLVRPARHRRRALPGPGPRRAHADLRRADPARRLAGGRQAGVRHHGGGARPDVLGADHDRRRDRHQAVVAGSGDLRPGARRPGRRDVPGLQVPHDGRRRRGPPGRAGGAQRGRRADVQDDGRPARHAGRRASCASCRSTRSRSSSTCCAAR